MFCRDGGLIPRINIEERWWIDPRREELIKKIGEMATDFTALKLWRLAQQFHRMGGLVPRVLYDKVEHSCLFIDVGLARFKEDLVEMAGQTEAFAWLDAAKAGGRVGGLKSKGKKSTLLDPIQASISSSSSSSKSIKEEERVELTQNKRLKPSRSADLPNLAVIWNKYSQVLPKVVGCGSTRRKLAENRWRDKPEEGYWIDIIKRIVSSDFCNGKNERGWRASFDFLIKPDTANKVLEGKYDSVQKQKTDYSFLKEVKL